MEELTETYILPYNITTEDRTLDENGDERFSIYLWSLDRESKPWLVKVEDFPLFMWIELPSIVNGVPFQWDDLQASKVNQYLCKIMDDKKPIEYSFAYKQKLYYYQGDKKYPMIMVKFRTVEAMNYCRNLLSKPRNIYGLGSLNFNVYESNIDPIRKFMTVINADFSSWLKVKGEEIPIDSHKRISTKGTVKKPNREISVSYKAVFPVNSKECESWFVFPRILSFDIETYTDNHKAMPNSLNSLHVCNIISCIYYELGNPNSKKKYVFVLGDSEPIEGAEVICVNNEIELINKFAHLIIDLDPEIISGYNIFAYDYPYLENRLKTKMEDWPNMGRLIHKPTEMSVMKWKSGAYGYQVINILEMGGSRLSIDMLPIVKRDYKLDKYSLDFVSKHFIGQEKHDVKPVDMFLAYEHQKFVSDKIKEYLNEKEEKHYKLNELFDGISQYKDTDPVAEKLYKRYLMARKEITRIVAYCVQDSNLVIDLFDKLNVWLGLNALSSVVGVTIIQLFTRGQQIRCLSQVFDKCFKKGIVLDKRIKDKVFYNGGLVQHPLVGMHTGVVCLDFASLYPSIMRAYNICFTTLVAPELFESIEDSKVATIEVEQEEPVDGAKAMKSGDADAIDTDFNDEEEDPDNEKEPSKTIFKTYKYKWVNKATRYGVLPEIQDHLVGSRNVIKKEIAALEDELEECSDPERLAQVKLLLVLKDKYSNALKVSANSLYGFLGAQEGGVLSLIEAAMCITSTGRKLINEVNHHVITKHNGTIVYGDSVTGDTPVLIRADGKVTYYPIENLVDWVNAKEWHGDKEMVVPDIVETWTERGWTPIKKVIRHKLHPNKKLYRVTTPCGYVDVTEDHSLVNKNSEMIKASDIKVGETELLHSLPLNETVTAYHDNWYQNEPKCLDAFIRYNTYMKYNRKLVESKFENKSTVAKIELLYAPKDFYVYDLETENHHFAVGPGALIVHNTDSSMVDLHIPDMKAAYAAGLALADEISGTPEKKLSDGTIIPAKPGLFPPPLKIEFEKLMKMLSIKKKKYAALLIDKNGEFVREKNKDGSLGELKILKRGIIVARRDTAKIVHKTYNKLLHMILTGEPVYKGCELVMSTLEDLVNDRLPVRENLSVIRSLGDNYKSDSYFMKVFGDELVRVGKPANPSDRLEYVIVRTKAEENGEKDVKLGLKMRLIDMYEDSLGIRSNKDAKLKEDFDESLILSEDDPLNCEEQSVAVYPAEKIDYEYYISHIMMASIDQLFTIGYMKELEKFKDIGYKPQFCRRKPVTLLPDNVGAKDQKDGGPIAIISKMIEDYKVKGYSVEHLKPYFTQIKEYYVKLLQDN